MERFKTKEEFLNEYGPNWRKTVPQMFPEGMDYLCGLPYSDNIPFRDYHQGWTISHEMLTDAPLPRTLTKEVIENYHKASIPVPSAYEISPCVIDHNPVIKTLSSYPTIETINITRYRLMSELELQQKYPEQYVVDKAKPFLIGLLAFQPEMRAKCGSFLTKEQWDGRIKVHHYGGEQRIRFPLSYGMGDWMWLEEWFIREDYLEIKNTPTSFIDWSDWNGLTNPDHLGAAYLDKKYPLMPGETWYPKLDLNKISYTNKITVTIKIDREQKLNIEL